MSVAALAASAAALPPKSVVIAPAPRIASVSRFDASVMAFSRPALCRAPESSSAPDPAEIERAPGNFFNADRDSP
jgi:hypothetical protein